MTSFQKFRRKTPPIVLTILFPTGTSKKDEIIPLYARSPRSLGNSLCRLRGAIWVWTTCNYTVRQHGCFLSKRPDHLEETDCEITDCPVGRPSLRLRIVNGGSTTRNSYKGVDRCRDRKKRWLLFAATQDCGRPHRLLPIHFVRNG